MKLSQNLDGVAMASLHRGDMPEVHRRQIMATCKPFRAQTRDDLMRVNGEVRSQLGITERLPDNGLTRREISEDTRRLRASKQSPAMTHKQRVIEARRKSLNAVLEQVQERRRERELKQAEDFGKRVAFKREIGAAGKAQEARDKASDAEADAAEARATGRPVSTGKMDAVPEDCAGPLHAEYRKLMAAGKSRLARRFWRENESGIQSETKQAVEGRKGR